MDERLKSALSQAAEAIKVLQIENSTLLSEKEELLAKLVRYHEHFGEIPLSTDTVGSLNMSVLQKKRKATPSKSKKQVHATSAVLSTWGGGSTVQFSEPTTVSRLEVETEEHDRDPEKINGKRQKKKSKETSPTTKNVVPCEETRSREKTKPAISSNGAGSGNESDTSSVSSRDSRNNVSMDLKETMNENLRKQGWSDVRHFIPVSAASSGDASSTFVPPSEPVIMNILGGLTRDNVYSCAVLLSSIPAVTVAGHLQGCLPRVASGFDGSALVTGCSLLQDYFESAGSIRPIISENSFALEALFSPALLAKLFLISEMLAAVNTRTNAGPIYICALLDSLRHRALATAMRDLLNPLKCIFCGDVGDRKHSSRIGGVAAAVLTSVPESVDMVMQNDFSYSDSDSDAEAENTETVVEGGNPVLSVEEMNCAAFGFVLVASSLRCGHPSHACKFLKDLSRQATNISCIGTILGVLTGIKASAVNSNTASNSARASSNMAALAKFPAMEVYVRNLGEQLFRTGPATGSGEDSCWRVAALRLASAECAQLASALALAASGNDSFNRAALRDLQIRGHGTFAILNSSTEDSGIQDAFSMIGICGLKVHSEILVNLLRFSDINSAHGAELAATFAAACLNEQAIPFSTSKRHLTESCVLKAFQEHWKRRLSLGTGVTNTVSDETSATLQDASRAFTELHEYFSTALCGEFDLVEGGWRVGVSGKGEALSVRIIVLIERIREKLHNLGAVITIPPNGSESLSLQLYSFTSASPDSIAQVSSAIHQCLQLGPEVYLHVLSNIADLSSILAAAALERLQFLTTCSALTLLRSTIETYGFLGSLGNDGIALIERLAKFLRSSPCFWYLPARAEVANIIQSAASILLAESESKCIPGDLESFVFVNRKRLPAFVINLDRRPDRFRKCILAAEAHQLLLLRISAVDGFKLGQSDSLEVDITADVDESSLRIPLEDVTEQWDSTLNSRFDSYCVVNPFTPMTNSERACAASHVKIWKTIRHLRHQLGHSTDAPLDADLNNDALEARRLASAYRECYRGRDDWYLIFEDDASISIDEARQNGSFRQAIERTMDAAPSDYDIIYLGWAIPFIKDTKAVNSIFLRPNYLWQLHAYILRGNAVDKLLGALPVNAPLDNFVAAKVHGGSLIAYALKDQLVKQDGSYKARQGESDIRHSGRDDVALRRGKLL